MLAVKLKALPAQTDFLAFAVMLTQHPSGSGFAASAEGRAAIKAAAATVIAAIKRVKCIVELFSNTKKRGVCVYMSMKLYLWWVE
jgi:hypothetical protein